MTAQDRLHRQMLAVYGRKIGRACRDCAHLTTAKKAPHIGSAEIVICELASKSVEWRSYLVACGKLSIEKEKAHAG